MYLSTHLSTTSSMLPIPLNHTFQAGLTRCSQVSSQEASKFTPSIFPGIPPRTFSSTLLSMLSTMLLIAHDGILALSVSNGSSFGPGRFYRSAWQRPYPIKNRRFFKRIITLRPQILIREFSVWYIKYVALHGASFGRLRFSISSNLSKR